jgi:hypothetical protein
MAPRRGGAKQTKRRRARDGQHPPTQRRQPVKPSTDDGSFRQFLARPPGRVIATLAVLGTLAAFLWGTGVQNVLSDKIADATHSTSPVGVVVEESEDGFPGWASSKLLPSPTRAGPAADGSVPAGEEQIALQLIGNRHKTVDIYRMGILVLRRRSPLIGTYQPTLGGGGTNAVQLQVNLTGQGATIGEPNTTSPTNDFWTPAPLKPYFIGRHITLSPGEMVPVAMYVRAFQNYYEWDLVIDFVYDGQKQTVFANQSGIVRNAKEGSPFRVTALAPRLNEYGEVLVGGLRVPPSDYCKENSTLDTWCMPS